MMVLLKINLYRADLIFIKVVSGICTTKVSGIKLESFTLQRFLLPSLFPFRNKNPKTQNYFMTTTTTTPVAMPFEANDFGPSVFQHSKSYGPVFPL